jgi:hypothetical protein
MGWRLLLAAIGVQCHRPHERAEHHDRKREKSKPEDRDGRTSEGRRRGDTRGHVSVLRADVTIAQVLTNAGIAVGMVVLGALLIRNQRRREDEQMPTGTSAFLLTLVFVLFIWLVIRLTNWPFAP